MRNLSVVFAIGALGAAVLGSVGFFVALFIVAVIAAVIEDEL